MTHQSVINQDTKTEQVAFMRRHPFATLVTSYHNKPVATNLPFIIRETAGQIYLNSYLAKTNKQWKHLEFEESLVIFQEPRPYLVSLKPEKIEHPFSSGFVALHAYGSCNIIHDQAKITTLLDMVIQSFESGYYGYWNALSSSEKEEMMQGLVAFEMKVNELKCKEDWCHMIRTEVSTN